jgi:hypothetical protein
MRRGASALLAAAAGVALMAQSPAPHPAGFAAGQHGRPHPGSYQHSGPYRQPGSYQQYPTVIILTGGSHATPTPKPKHRATPRPADAPDVFETHSTSDTHG